MSCVFVLFESIVDDEMVLGVFASRESAIKEAKDRVGDRINFRAFEDEDEWHYMSPGGDVCYRVEGFYILLRGTPSDVFVMFESIDGEEMALSVFASRESAIKDAKGHVGGDRTDFREFEDEDEWRYMSAGGDVCYRVKAFPLQM